MKNIAIKFTVSLAVIVIFFTVSRAVRSADILSLGSEDPSPVSLNSKYIRAVSWPPKVQIQAKSFECIPGGEEFSRTGLTTIELIQGDTYCLNRTSEVAASHVYTKFIFSQARGEGTKVSTFSIGRDQCEDYFPARREKCEQEQNNFSPNVLILAPQSFGKSMDLCYFYGAKSQSGFYDYAWLKMNIDGSRVSGEYWSLPAGEESKVGSFSGTLSRPKPPYSTQTVEAQWKTFENGKRGLEQLIFEFNYNNAVIVSDEGIYEATEQVFSQIDCERLEEKPVVEQQMETLARFI